MCGDCLNQGFWNPGSRQSCGESYCPCNLWCRLAGSFLPMYTTLYVGRLQAWSLPLRELQIVFILILTPPVMMYPWILKIGFASREPSDISLTPKIIKQTRLLITRVKSVICTLWVVKASVIYGFWSWTKIFEKPSPCSVPSQGLYSKYLSRAWFIISNYVSQNIDLRYLVAPPQILIQLPNDIYFEIYAHSKRLNASHRLTFHLQQIVLWTNSAHEIIQMKIVFGIVQFMIPCIISLY